MPQGELTILTIDSEEVLDPVLLNMCCGLVLALLDHWDLPISGTGLHPRRGRGGDIDDMCGHDKC